MLTLSRRILPKLSLLLRPDSLQHDRAGLCGGHLSVSTVSLGQECCLQQQLNLLFIHRKTYTNKSKTFEEDGHEDDKIYESDKLCDEDGMMMLSNGLPEYVPPPPPPPIRPMFDLEYLQHPFGLVELRPSDMTNINRQQQQQQLGPAFVQTLQRYPKDPKPFVVENGDEGFHPFSTLQRPRYTECALDEHIITTHSNMSMKMNTGSVQNVHNIVGLAAQPRQTDI